MEENIEYRVVYDIERVVYDLTKESEVGLVTMSGETETLVFEAKSDEDVMHRANLKRVEVQPAVFRREGLKTISVEAVVSAIYRGEVRIYGRDKGGLDLFIDLVCQNGKNTFVVGLYGDSWICLGHEEVARLAKLSTKEEVENSLFGMFTDEQRKCFVLSDKAFQVIQNY